MLLSLSSVSVQSNRSVNLPTPTSFRILVSPCKITVKLNIFGVANAWIPGVIFCCDSFTFHTKKEVSHSWGSRKKVWKCYLCIFIKQNKNLQTYAFLISCFFTSFMIFWSVFVNTGILFKDWGAWFDGIILHTYHFHNHESSLLSFYILPRPSHNHCISLSLTRLLGN